MPRFRYEARQKDGTRIEGEIEASHRGHALVLLRKRGLVVDALRETSVAVGRRQGPLYLLWPVRRSHIGLFFDQLGRLLAAGVTPHEAFTALQDRVGGRLRRVAKEGAQSLGRGGNIAQHLERYPSFFPSHLVSIFRAGERSGDFSGACQEIVQQCETESRIRRHINLLKLYLGIILLVCILVPSFPRIISHVVEADPNRTTVVMTVGGLWEYLRPGLVWYGEHVVHDIVPWLVGVWVLSKVVGVVFYGPGRVVRHHLAFYLPVVGTATRKAGMARFLRVLELMQRAAVPLGDSVREAAQATGNCVMAGRLTGAAGVLEVGGRLSEVLRRAGLCSPSQISLVTTAEESGTLVEGLGQLANRAREERESFLKGMGWGGCATAFIAASVVTLFAAAVGWKALYEEIYRVFESEVWMP